MNRIWEHMIHTAIAGAERSPLPGHIGEACGIKPSDDPAQTAVDALAAIHVLHKAAAPLHGAPATVPPPCAPDERPVCRPAALRDLMLMVFQGTYAEALPEFFSLLTHSGKRLPPESLPAVLDFLSRKKMRQPAMLAALGPLGPWLARQNPHWSGLFAPEQAHWETGSFAQRQELLREARRTHARTGLAWLEKTWAQERPEQKQVFLEILRLGLSQADEPLLLRAAADKSGAVRLTAYRLLLLLPESLFAQRLQGLLAQRLNASAGPDQLLGMLETLLPDDGPFAALPLLGLRTAGKTGPADSAVAAFLRVTPAAMLATAGGLSPDQLMAALGKAPRQDWLEAALDQLAWHAEPEWLETALRFLSETPEHPLWHSAALENALAALAEPAWGRLLPAAVRHDMLLEAPGSALVQALLSTGHPWPKSALKALLEYPLRTGQARQWQPPPHFRLLLQRAAYGCRTDEAEHLAQHMPDGNLPHAWQSELTQFWNVARFRRRMGLQLMG